MQFAVPQLNDQLLGKFRLTRFHRAEELEDGGYWPQLQPHFIKPYFRRLRYQVTGETVPRQKLAAVLATRGATGLGDLDIAYVADPHPTVMSITETGLPDYCLTFVLRGALEYESDKQAQRVQAGRNVGLIYRGLPGTRISATEDHERLSIWIPASCLRQRLAALLEQPIGDQLDFCPRIDWESGPGQRISRLAWLLTEELASDQPLIANGVARQSLTDLWLYALLQGLAHNYTDRLASAASAPAPRTVRRAEAFIRANAERPVTLQEVAEAAGCSVRALQIGFRRFRETTPAAVMRQARLEAARQALMRGEVEGTVTDIAYRYGFSNPGRFAGLYKAAFGVSPAADLHGYRPLARIA